MEQYIIFVRLDVQLKQAVNDVNTGEGISENAFSSKQHFHTNARQTTYDLSIKTLLCDRNVGSIIQ